MARHRSHSVAFKRQVAEEFIAGVASPHEVVQVKCQCMAGLGGADPAGPGALGNMGSAVSTTSGAGGR